MSFWRTATILILLCQIFSKYEMFKINLLLLFLLILIKNFLSFFLTCKNIVIEYEVNSLFFLIKQLLKYSLKSSVTWDSDTDWELNLHANIDVSLLEKSDRRYRYNKM